MRHAKRTVKFATDASHRNAILHGLAAELLKHGKIKTTEVRAKAARRVIDKIIGLAKRGDLHSRRQAMALLGDKKLVHDIFEEMPERFKDRPGGYTRIMKLGPRKGDAAPVVIIELV